jgi:hypothetical protein
MKGARLIIYPFLLILGLSIGAWIGFSFGDWMKSRILATPTPFVSPIQQNVLVVGVDQLTPGAQLVSMWFVAYLPDQPVVYLIPIYPGDRGRANSQDQALLDAFRLDGRGRISEAFFQTLGEVQNIRWDGYVVLDQFAMIEIVEFLSRGAVNGPLALGEIPYPSRDYQAALAGQVALLKQLCDHMSALEAGAEADSVLALIPSRMNTSMDLAGAEGDWQKMITQSSHLRCEFPTLDLDVP